MGIEKIKSAEEIAEIVKKLRAENPGIKIVTTNGTFDIMHAGHVKSLREAKTFGDILIVGLNSDSSVKSYKSPNRPIISQDDRSLMMASLEMVDYVLIFYELDPNRWLAMIDPDIHVKSKQSFSGVDRVVNGKIELIDDIPGISTSEIIRRIKALP
jgi:D-beta-D-heptose 7-phosphate kinase/D-beta-D-heptose 1-phosphate adenosyltransferase